MNLKIFRIVLVTFGLMAVVAALAYQFRLFTPGERSSGVALIGGPFSLVDQDGRARRDTDFRGRLMLIYFGYTFCPDVCPTALQIMTVALGELGDKAKQVQPILITIDPERDTKAILKSYAANFYPGLVALTGTEDAIAAAARAYRVYFARPKDQAAGADYLMDHTSIIYLMGRDGTYLTHFTHNTDAQAMAAAIRKHL